MKRILSLLLALTMVFSLCACGSKEKTADQNIEYETEVKNVHVISTDSKFTEQAFFEIYEARLQKTSKEGIYYPDFKIKCTFSPYEQDQNTTYFITVHYLDKDGVIIKQREIYVEHLNVGDMAWTSSFSSGRATESYLDPNEVATVKIAGYRAHLNGDNKKFNLDEPIVFTVADLEIA